MSRTACLSCAGLLFAALSAIAQAPATAQESEVRSFTVSIDGKKAGTYTLTVAPRSDGTILVTEQAEVRISYLVYNYSYAFRGQELWRGNALQQMNTASNDDGKRYTLSAIAFNDGLHVTVNGQQHIARADAWPTTYWHLPPAERRNGPIILLDADTGRDLSARMQPVGANRINVGGQPQDCVHYRLTGQVTVDVWYDSQDRLVRQDSVEDGHRTVLELVGLRRQ
jgi:hypothetical protein